MKFSQLKKGQWFRFCSKYYRHVVFIKTNNEPTPKEEFAWEPYTDNTIWIKGRYSGGSCYFSDEAKVVRVKKWIQKERR